jgi:hypothetical protein
VKLIDQGAILADSETTITGLPALIIILLILAGIIGIGVVIGRLSRRPKK